MIKAIGSIVSSVFSFISLMLMTRFVGAEYGLMMWGWALIGLVNTLATLGLNSATVKFISEGKDQNVCISTHIFLKIFFVIAIVGITLLYIFIEWMRGNGLGAEMIGIIVIFLAYYIISDFVGILISAFDGRMDATRSTIVQTVENITRSTALMIMAVLSTSAVILSSGYLIGIVVAGIVSLFFLTHVGFEFRRPLLIKEYISFMKPVAVGMLLVTSITFIDRVIIGYFYGEMAVGYYSAAIGIFYAAAMLGTTINLILLPQLSKLYAGRDQTETREIIWSAQKYATMLFLPAVVFMMVYGNTMAIFLFGIDYSAAGPVLSILSASIYLNLLAGMLTQLLYSSNNANLYRNSTMIYVSITLVLFIILIPDHIGPVTLMGWGIEGAAASVTAGYAIFLISLAYFVKKSQGISLYPRLSRHLIAVATSCVFLIYVRLNIEDTGIMLLLLFFMLGLMIYCFVLWALREFNKKDVIFLIGAINPKNLRNSMNEEMKK